MKLRIKLLSVLAISAVTMISFQNCDQGFGNATDQQLDSLNTLDAVSDAESEESELVFNENQEFQTSSAPSQIISKMPSINRLWRVTNSGRTVTVRIYKGRYFTFNSSGQVTGRPYFSKFLMHINGRYVGEANCTSRSKRYCNVRYTFREDLGWDSGESATFKIAGMDPDKNYTPISAEKTHVIP